MWLRPRNYSSYWILKLHRLSPRVLHDTFSTRLFVVDGPASRNPCMKPPRKPQHATLCEQSGLSGKATSVSVASTLQTASSAGTRVRRRAVGILSGLPKDQSFSHWKAP